jgi:hypothetical protein
MATNITPELKTNRAAHLLAQNVTKLMETVLETFTLSGYSVLSLLM